jgi:GNAT superfamily N-acetyltransferase
MPTYTIHLTTPIRETFRTHQVAGLFDLALDDLVGERFAHTLTAELPGVDEDWTIGAIVGPSGIGKTTLARAAYGAALYEPQPWPEDVAIIDALDDSSLSRRVHAAHRPRTAGLSIKHLLRTLTAVGLASPPSWLKPYRVLSTGERFRADLARALLASGVRKLPDSVASPTNPRHREADASRSPWPLVVFDEFTSTLDRTVACTASFALAKYLRRQEPGTRSQEPGTRNQAPLAPGPRSLAPVRFVALSCHTDFLPWLAPDWILDLSESRSLTPSGTSPPVDALFPRGSSAGASRNAPLVPHGVRDLLFPHWPGGSRERRELRLEICRVPQRLWLRFAKHHYLSGGLSTAATCYAAFWDETCWRAGCVSTPMAPQCETTPPRHREADASRSPESPIAFCAVLATLGHRRTKHITRLVVLPEFQGLGIGPRLAESVAAIEAAKGNRVTITASHPSILAWCSRSPRWKYLGLKKTGSTRQTLGARTIRCSTGRAVASFEFVREGEAPAEP